MIYEILIDNFNLLPFTEGQYVDVNQEGNTMKSNRSEYQTQQEIIRGFKPRRIVPVPQGGARVFNLLVWLLVGFCIPFMALNIIF